MIQGTDQDERHLSDADVVALLEGRATPEASAHLALCPTCRLLYESSGAVLAEDHVVPVERRSRRLRGIVAASGFAIAATILLALFLPSPEPELDFSRQLPTALWPEAERLTGQWMVVPGFEDVAAHEVPLRRSHEASGEEFTGLVAAELARMESGTASQQDYVRGVIALLAEGEVTSARRWSLRAAEERPEDRGIAFLRALTAQQVGDFDAAADVLSSLCDGGDGAATFCLDLVLVLAQTGQVHEARAALERLEGITRDENLLARGRSAVAAAER